MRRFVLFSGLLLVNLFAASVRVSAQDTPEPAPVRHQESDENYRILTAKIEDLAVANETLRLEVTRLKEALQKLADEVSAVKDRSSKDTATMESLKQLKLAIEEVDSKRIADQKLVVNEFESLRKLLERPPPQTQKPPPPAEKNRSNVPEKGYNYTIKEGDTLSAIVAALRSTGLKITSKQVMDANPGVNWNRLKVNQVIFIPAPAQ